MEGPFILLPLTKGPCAKGRVGPREWQDWYRGLVMTRKLLSRYPNSLVLILSNLQVEGERHEADIYCEAAIELGIPHFVAIHETYETMGQLEYALEMAKEEGHTLVVISTWLHFPRVWWLCRGHEVKHHVAWGIPRPSLALADIILTFAMPVIDLLGRREWFKKRLEKRRTSGKL